MDINDARDQQHVVELEVCLDLRRSCNWRVEIRSILCRPQNDIICMVVNIRGIQMATIMIKYTIHLRPR